MSKFSVISPIDGKEALSVNYSTDEQIQQALEAARNAQVSWRGLSLAERKAFVSKAIDWLVEHKDDVARSITTCIGRPISQSPGEVRGLEERARYMIDVAEHALADIVPAPKEGFKRYLRREPLGTVMIIAPWNYPFLTAVNAIVPALVAGNTVLLKHASQTPLAAELFQKAFDAAGLPAGVFQTLYMTHSATERVLRSDYVDFVAFTGSVGGGKRIQSTISERFIGSGLELGGKDPAYVRADADVNFAAENLVDGSFFNSGQSCCGVERIYVHASIFDAFVAKFVEVTKQYKLGDPTDPSVNLGPMVSAAAAATVKAQIEDAVAKGAKKLIDESLFPAHAEGTAYHAPQVLINVNHSMAVMTEESFGPVVGIMAVADDEEAIRMMNDSQYGLTASIWTKDQAAAEAIGAQVATGTVFMNRCDYLDPALAWTGVKDTGRGISLSELGYHQLTRVKSYHLRNA